MKFITHHQDAFQLLALRRALTQAGHKVCFQTTSMDQFREWIAYCRPSLLAIDSLDQLVSGLQTDACPDWRSALRAGDLPQQPIQELMRRAGHPQVLSPELWKSRIDRLPAVQAPYELIRKAREFFASNSLSQETSWMEHLPLVWLAQLPGLLRSCCHASWKALQPHPILSMEVQQGTLHIQYETQELRLPPSQGISHQDALRILLNLHLYPTLWCDGPSPETGPIDQETKGNAHPDAIFGKL